MKLTALATAGILTVTLFIAKGISAEPIICPPPSYDAGGFCNSAPGHDKTMPLPDPNRDYFDACGNQFSYDGVLKEQGSGCDITEDPVADYTEYSAFEGK